MLQGLIQEGHVPVNKYKLIIPGMPTLTITKLSGLDEELEKATMPDRTVHSNGQTKPMEMTIELPMHHDLEQAAMEVWYRMSKDPVVPGYKRAGTLLHMPVTAGGVSKTFALSGIFPFKRKTPEMDMANETDAATVEWSLSVDGAHPI